MSEAVPSATTPCERCGTPLILVSWDIGPGDGGKQWMERIGWTLGMTDVWATHTQENCTKARARALEGR